MHWQLYMDGESVDLESHEVAVRAVLDNGTTMFLSFHNPTQSLQVMSRDPKVEGYHGTMDTAIVVTPATAGLGVRIHPEKRRER